jgi:hypothetical protein
MGPNCVQTVVEHHNVDFGDGVTLDQTMTYSTVYRMKDTSKGTSKVIVWGKDLGEVLQSTEKYLTIKVVAYGSSGGPVEDILTAKWNGKRYVTP